MDDAKEKENSFFRSNRMISKTFFNSPRLPPHLTFFSSLTFLTCEFKIDIDPLGQPTVTVGRDHMSPSVPTFQNLAKQNKVKTILAAGETVGQAEWIIDDTCLVIH